MEYIEVTGKTIAEAQAKAQQLLSERSAKLTHIEVLEEPKKGLFGFGGRPARIQAYYREMSALEELDSLLGTEEAPYTDSITSTSETETASTVVETVAVDEISAAVMEVALDAPVAAPVDKKAEGPWESPAQYEVDIAEVAHREVRWDVVAERGKAFLQDMLNKMKLDVMIEKRITEERITFSIYGDNLGLLIGKHGQTLDAIQYLTNIVANKEEYRACPIMVDVEDYRARRERSLQQLAKRLSEKVRRNRQRISLEPMNAYERKVIHLALQQVPHISTASEGEGAARHVVIDYVP